MIKKKENIHKCGGGYWGEITKVRRPGVGPISFCGFCGKEFRGR